MRLSSVALGYRGEAEKREKGSVKNHPEVKNAVVIPIPDDLIGNRISAVVLPLIPSRIRKGHVLKHCSTRLPKYMIPEIMEFRASLPATSTGELDRKELSALMVKQFLVPRY